MKRRVFVFAFGLTVATALVIACGADHEDLSSPSLLDDGGGKDASAALFDAGNAHADAGVDGGPSVGWVDGFPEHLPDPTFTPPAGSYTAPQCGVVISAAKGVIHYTLDGSTPTAASPTYGDPIPVGDVSMPTTIKAIAIADAGVSAVATASYTISLIPEPAHIPTPSPEPGSFDGGVELTMKLVAIDPVICYTLDGGSPSCVAAQTTGNICFPDAGGVTPGYCKNGIQYDGGAVAIGGDAGTQITLTASGCSRDSLDSHPGTFVYSF